VAREKKSILVETISDHETGETVELFYNPNPNRNGHEAEIDDASFFHVDINELKKLVRAALIAKNKMTWEPVIHVLLAAGASGISRANVVGMELERFYMAKRVDERWSKSQWETPSDKRIASRMHVSTDFVIGGAVHKNQWTDPEYYLHYTEELWQRLNEIQVVIQRSKTQLGLLLDSGPEAILAPTAVNLLEAPNGE
jgi:hypothetical protein